MFEDSTFETNGIIRTHSRDWMLAAFLINSSIVVALILFPLIYPQALPRQMISSFMDATLPPYAPQQHRQQPARAVQAAPHAQDHPFVAPRIIPDSIIVVDKPEAVSSIPNTGHNLDVGAYSRVLPVLPGKATAPIVRPERAGPVHLSTSVVEGLLLEKTAPSYPAIAMTTRTEGTVVLAATISKTGTIENLRVVSGPLLLQQAAVDAVRIWRYKPYLLDGQPVDVETTVNVIFSLQ